MTKSRAWCFTLNNFTREESTKLVNFIGDEVEYAIVGNEKGEEGTPHLQGYLYFKNARGFANIKACISDRLHLEKAKGTAAQNKEYCSKEEVLLEYGTVPEQGKRNDFGRLIEAIQGGNDMRSMLLDGTISNAQLLRAAPSMMTYLEPERDWETEVIWLYGEAGAGKTRQALSMIKDRGFRCFKKTLAMGPWWDGYDGQEGVILDDLRDSQIRPVELLGLLDRYDYRVPIKGGSRSLVARVIVITSITPPWTWWPMSNEPIAQLKRRVSSVIQLQTQKS